MAIATLYSQGSPCNCDCVRRIKDKPCTDCCTQDLGTESYFETHGSDECPNVGEPCPSGDGTPSCANARIGPISLRSDEFQTDCLDKLKPVAIIGYSADNFGLASGESGEVGCPSTSTIICDSCSEIGEVTPFVDSVGNGKSVMRITAFAQNAPHGGPYSLAVTATFSLIPK